MDEQYIRQNQRTIDLWKSYFRVLDQWKIIFSVDEEKWSMIEYNIKARYAKIYVCDIDDEESYLLNQVLKIAFIECDNIEKRISFIEDLTTVIMEK